jgi:GWxTD domain-containing protein
MTRKTRFLALITLLAALLAGPAAAQTKIKEKDLTPRHQEWLHLVAYIMLPAERDVFLSLPNDLDRDAFIDAFWKQRDPTPATPQNEYKEEIVKRFQYVNSFYHRGTSRPGWMTDMGRIYMIMGAPASIERFENVSGLYPTQVWYYYGDKAKGQPTNFAMIFYQARGGEFRLYSPVGDGPESLIVDTKGLDVTNHQTVYEKLREMAPTLATVSLSLIPGQLPFGYAPSPQAAMVISSVFDAPKKDVNPAYATHFLHYKGMVSTEYLTNFVESSGTAEVIPDPVLGLNFLHFSVSPRKLSIDYYQPRDQYYCNFKVSVSLRRGDQVVFQYTRDFPFYFPPDRTETIQGSGVSVLDAFPIAEGTFALTVLLQNAVGKEFSLFEKEVRVPDDGGPVRLAGPVIGYGLQDPAPGPAQSGVPFRVAGRQLLTDPKGTLGLGDAVAFALAVGGLSQEVWKDGAVEMTIAGSLAKDRTVKSLVLKLADQPYARTMAFAQSFPARELAPDYYEMALSLKDGKGTVLARASAPFIISPAEVVPHPVTLARPVPAANIFLFHFGLAIQYDRAGDSVRAEAAYRKGVEMKPDYAEGLAEFADFLLRTKKYDECLRFAEMLKGHEKFLFQHHLLKGLALMEKAEYEPAIQSLLAGNRIYNSDTRLLNGLGFSYYKTGRRKEALEALGASLRLNADQAEVKALVATVEKELR